MTLQLPKGKSIGTMQASTEWIFSHTVRFMGLVRLDIDDAEGFILINKGTPLAFYFRQEGRELKGKAALEYLKKQDIITFQLFKYNSEEFREALAICTQQNITPPVETQVKEIVVTPQDTNREERTAAPSPETESTANKETGETGDEKPQPHDDTDEGERYHVSRLLEAAEYAMDEDTSGETADGMPAVPSEEGGKDDISPETEAESSAGPTIPTIPSTTEKHPAGDADSEIRGEGQVEVHTGESMEEQAGVDSDQGTDVPEAAAGVSPHPSSPTAPPDEQSEQFRWILRRKGVIAAALFREGHQVASTGEAEFEHIAADAEEAFHAASEIADRSQKGAMVQMTIEVPGGYAILYPYDDGHLFILTTKETHLGQIRSIIKELKQRSGSSVP